MLDEQPVTATSVSPPLPDLLPDLPAEIGRGVLFAAVAASVGAIAWAVVLAYVELQSWLVGAGIGYVVALAALYGAGQATLGLKVAISGLVIASVITGEFLGMALAIHRAYGFFDLPLAVEVYLEDPGSDLAFALGAAGVGVVAGLASLKRRGPEEPELLKPDWQR